VSFEEVLFDYLTGDEAIAALVELRVYPVGSVPERCPVPYITWNRVDANRLYTYDEFDENEPWVTARIQFNCWAYTAMESMDMGSALLAALSGYGDDMGGQLITSFSVNELDTFEPGTKFHRRVLDFFISYQDSVKSQS